ncbi:LysR family transcriptional regulator [Pseudonocardia sp. WMMC193]|uniref:LysR family transcriptional regulator n=1 Tax=Pseudonocardia sp. WMMC193 TaxID=2911965 RepID=UPI001F303ECB|nr:LysR family transcriptional regulator [Pseudonocardia sp. WMMC193]MCF7547877.1 LysR family transcriptional regulator [Pseudonocardia sp. WMMC193]
MDDERVMAALVPRLRWFVAVGRAEHVTQAADELGVPQSTLSRGIARLEAEIGTPLFARSGRAVRLTREGRGLLRHAERALAELATGARELAGEVDGVTGRVTLAFLPTLGTEVVPRLIGEFRATAPGIRFELRQAPHHTLLDWVREDAADLALTSPLPAETGLAADPLGEEELRLAVPADHPLAARPGVALREIAGERLIGFLPGNGLRAAVDRWCRESGFTPRPAFESADSATVRGFVGAGLGVALVPVSHHGPPPGVVELRVTAPRTVRTIGLVRSREREPSTPARTFADFVRDRGLPWSPW